MPLSTGLRFTARLGDLPAFTFAVVDFELEEAFNAPFELTLRLASHQPDIDFGAVLDKPCELDIWYDGQLQRRVSGIVGRFEQGNTGFQRTRYEARVYPALWRTGLRRNCRIFQLKTPQEIIGTLLKEAGVTEYDFSLRDEHLPREYCVQYRETDLDFIRRLAAEEGMFFWHTFEEGAHRLLFADHQAPLSVEETLFFSSDRHGLEQGAYVHALSYREAVKTARVELRDYTFRYPAVSQSNKKQGNDLAHQREQYEHYDYPGRYKDGTRGKAFSRYRLEGLRAEAASAEGGSNCAGLRPGIRFELTQHRNPEFNALWQVISAVHTGKQPAALEEESGDQPTTFDNIFTVVRGETGTFWRPAQQVRPVMDGPQIAIVTGPDTEEIYCDEHGRVKVRFPWDREGRDDGLSSCWLRVSQNWAGGRYGSVTLPRVGHEVLVSFLDGDPDQPVITGRTYHGTNKPPYPLPENKTRTVLRTDTHQGQGFNELSFEDAAHREQVYLHAQRDADTVINHDDRRSVGNDQHLSVGQDRSERIDRHSHHTTGQDRYEQIGQDKHQTVGRNLIQRITQSVQRFIGGGEVTRIEGSRQSTITGSDENVVGGSHRTSVNKDTYLKARDIVLEATDTFTLRGPGGFIRIDEEGIIVCGNLVKVNEGGVAGTGIAPVSVLPESAVLPQAPDAPARPAPEQHAQAAHKKPEPEKLPDTCACDRDITIAEFKKIATRAPADKIQEYLDALNLWMPWNGITTCRAKAHFLAQASVETGSFNSMVEGNGNTKPYSPYYGRGIMQLTKKENYTSYGNYASFDFTSDVHTSYDNVAKHPHSFLSGFWYYCIHTDCSSSAEKDDFNMISARINGGFNGYNQRLSKFNEISMILKTEHLCKLEKSNVFSFEDSEIYNYKAYAYAWGRWHDHNDNSAIGTDKDASEALKGYIRAKYLYQAHNDTDMVKKIDKRISDL